MAGEVISQALIVETKMLLRNSAQNINQVAEKLKFKDQPIFFKFSVSIPGILHHISGAMSCFEQLDIPDFLYTLPGYR